MKSLTVSGWLANRLVKVEITPLSDVDRSGPKIAALVLKAFQDTGYFVLRTGQEADWVPSEEDEKFILGKLEMTVRDDEGREVQPFIG